MKIIEKGQSLIELLVAIGVAAVILPGLTTGFMAATETKAQEGQRLEATALHTEMEEAVHSFRQAGWIGIATTGTFHPTVSGSSWTLTAGSESINGFTRQLVISNTSDPGIRQVDYTTGWSEPNPSSVTSTQYFSRWLGNTTKTHTTQADFNLGTFSNTRSTAVNGGTVELIPAVASGSFIDDFTTGSDYNYDSAKIEVINSFAQLKNIGTPISGQTTNPGFNTGITGWTFAAYGTDISQAGSYQASGGNPGGYIRINFPRNSNKQSGAYYAQAFTTSASNPSSNLSFNWRVTAYPTATTSLRLYAWIDSAATGTPATQVWDSGNITGTTAWSGTVTINAAPYITTPGTYYLKVGAFINISSGNKGPYTLGFDNVSLSWSGTGMSYAADSPTIYPKTSFQPTAVTSWDSFSTVEVPNGGSVRYQLSDDNGTTWKYWSGAIWTTATLPTNYNDTATINSHISTFPAVTGKILIKAFLIGNGSQQVKLDKITIGYTGSTGTNSGTFTSATMDFGSDVGINHLYYTTAGTANTTT